MNHNTLLDTLLPLSYPLIRATLRMDMIPLKPERLAQLEEYAQRHGQDPAAALDDALATYLEWERQDSEEASAGIRQGYEDVRAGRTRLATEVLTELRRKHDLPR